MNTLTIDSALLTADTVAWLSKATPTDVSIVLNSAVGFYRAWPNRVSDDSADSDVKAITPLQATPLQATPPIDSVVPNWKVAEKSAEKGKLAEQYIVDMLADRFGKNNVSNTAKTSKSGDIELIIDQTRIVIEIKNYRTTVTQKEVTKFCRDLGVRTPHAGLFISLGSNIVGVASDFEIKYERVESQIVPCVYLVGQHPSVIYAAILVLRQMVANKRQLIDDLGAGELLRRQLDKIIEAAYSLTRYRSDMSENMTTIQQMLCKNWQDITSAELIIKNASEELSREYGELRTMIGASESVLSKFNPQNLTEVREVFNIVNARYPTDSVWVITNKKATHEESNISLLFTRINAELAIPVSNIDSAKIQELIAVFGSKFKITNGCIVLPVDNTSLAVIGNIIAQ